MGFKSFLVRKMRKLFFGYRASSESYINYLRKKGAKIGKNVTIFSPVNTTIDIQNPYLLSIGNNIIITGPATILTHDYAVFVCNCMHKKQIERIDSNRPVVIGNNVFLGWGCTILAGTTIGNNVIIGANAVVGGNVESNSVYAGNPAKRIMSVDEYYEKRMKCQSAEIETMFLAYKEFFKADPDENIFSPAYRNHFRSKGNENRELLGKTFENYQEFCDYMQGKQKG